MSTSEGHRAASPRDPSASVEQSGPGPDQELTAELVRSLAEQTSVCDLMSRKVICLSPDAHVQAVTEMFLDRDLSAAPVVDEHWLPVGMVSKTDLLRFAAEGELLPGSLAQQQRQKQGHSQAPPAVVTTANRAGVRIAEITLPYVLSLHEEAPVSVAAALMAYEGVHRLPIVCSAGEVVGILSTLDIVRWLAQNTGMGPGGTEVS